MSEQIHFKQPSGHLGQEPVSDCTAHQLAMVDSLGNPAHVPYACLRREGCVKCPVAIYASEHGVTPVQASKGELTPEVNAGITFNYMQHVAKIPLDRLEGTVVAGYKMDHFIK